MGYDSRAGPMAPFFQGRKDDRFPAIERIVAVDIGRGWAAPFSKLAEARVVNATVESRPIVVAWVPGVASALDAQRIAEGRDVGQTTAFDRRARYGDLEVRSIDTVEAKMAKISVVVLADTESPADRGACRTQVVRRSGVELLGEYEGHPSLRDRVAGGFQIVTF